jgi:hypothetical protein
MRLLGLFGRWMVEGEGLAKGWVVKVSGGMLAKKILL